MIWPAAIILLAHGMLAVAVLDPKDRVIHLTVGMLLLAGGWADARFRLGEITRRSADALVVTALLAAAFEMGVIHAQGEPRVIFAHVLLGACGVALAAVRLYQSARPLSLPRAALSGLVVMVMALDLLALDSGAT
jgi:hypothetical protein